MRLNDWLQKMEILERDPEVCSLPEDDDEKFSAARLSLAITEMGTHCPAGKFGYLQHLAGNPDSTVARDALKMLEPQHPGDQSAEEGGDEWRHYWDARGAWLRLRSAFPVAWLDHV